MSKCHRTLALKQFAIEVASLPTYGIKAPILFHFKSKYFTDLLNFIELKIFIAPYALIKFSPNFNILSFSSFGI